MQNAPGRCVVFAPYIASSRTKPKVLHVISRHPELFFPSSRTNVRDLLARDKERGDSSSQRHALTSPLWGSCAASSFLAPLRQSHKNAVHFCGSPIRGDEGGIVNVKSRVSKSIPQSLRDSSLYTREPLYFLPPLRQSHKNTASFCGSLIWEGAERSELSPSLPSLCKGGCRAERGGRVVKVRWCARTATLSSHSKGTRR